jgi:hypothetical protein
MVIADVWDVANQHLASFAIGAGVGFVLSNRYRITRRNGKDD